MEGTLAEIRMYAGNFPPRGWQYCHGQFLPISQNAVLFSLMGNAFGGDGLTEFALPDFRGRVAVGAGQGTSLSNTPLGEIAGNNTTTLQVGNMPAHNHVITGNVTPIASSDGTIDTDATSRYWGPAAIYSTAHDLVEMVPISAAGLTLEMSGENQPLSLMQPYLCVHYIICTEGAFPCT